MLKLKGNGSEEQTAKSIRQLREADSAAVWKTLILLSAVRYHEHQ
jgi:hypothetical protein